MCGEDVHADHKRKKIKDLLKTLQADIPEIKNSLLASLTNVKPSHLLDTSLWKF
jgi:tRNA 2-thiocytidine biosynthesis protein TtcA